MKHYRERTTGSGRTPQEVMQAAAREWNQLSGDARAPFLLQAAEDKARYQAEKAQYQNGQ